MVICGLTVEIENSKRIMLNFFKQRRCLQIAFYLTAIVLVIALAVYGVMEQSSFADALVESFVE